MSRYDLRDISDRLARSADAEAVTSEFLAAIEQSHPDWRATLAFYEVSRDALVKLYDRDKGQLRSREIKVMVDQLPARMIRNFFHPNSTLEPQGRKSILAPFVQTPPMFEPDLNDAVLLRAMLPVATWNSCMCLPLTDREEMLAIVTIVSQKRNAFGTKAMDEIMPLKTMTAFALAGRLHRASRSAVEHDPHAAKRAAEEFRETIEQLGIHARELEQDNQAKSKELKNLTQQIDGLDQHSDGYRTELDRVKQALSEMEQQSTRATENLSEASAQLETAVAQLAELRGTLDFARQVFGMLAASHDPRQFPGEMVRWLSDRFGVDRCSAMLLDRSGYILRIAEQAGIPPEVAERVRVRVGQGVAGWVALHRKPLFVRVRDDAAHVPRNVEDTYNPDSFVCVPILYNDRVTGVLSLSNKRDGTAFTDADLDRAVLAAGVCAITFGANEAVRRALAWAA